MTGFFRTELLDTARLLVLAGERVANPDFYPMLSGMGFMKATPDPAALVLNQKLTGR
jgi:hypothetical protein